MTPLGQRLREARLRKGLTLQEVAGALGYKYRTVVHSWEKGYRVPKLQARKRLAELYGVDITEFLDD